MKEGESMSSTNLIVLIIVCPIVAAIFFLALAIMVNVILSMKKASPSSQKVRPASPSSEGNPNDRREQTGVGDYKRVKSGDSAVTARHLFQDGGDNDALNKKQKYAGGMMNPKVSATDGYAGNQMNKNLPYQSSYQAAPFPVKYNYGM